MAEECPKAVIDEDERAETPALKVTSTFLSPEDQTETGYSSAPYSPDLLSGAESSYWISDDRSQEDKKTPQTSPLKKALKQRSPKHAALEVSSNLEVAKTETRTSKFGFVKKQSPVKPKQAVKASEKKSKGSSAKYHRVEEPSEEACAAVKATTSQDSCLWKSEERPPSPEEIIIIVPQPEAAVETIEPVTSKSPKEKSTKSPRKGLLSKLSSFKSPKKSEKPRVVVSLPKEEKTTESEDKTPETSTRRKIIQKFKKSPAKHLEQGRLSSTDVEAEIKSEGSPKKTKKSPYRFSPKKYKALKQDEPASKLSPGKEPGETSDKPIPKSPFDVVRRGIEKMDISGRFRKHSPKRCEETSDLIDEPQNVASGAAKETLEKSSDAILVDLPPKSAWKPQNKNQEGGFVEGELLLTELSSVEEPETPTELSLLSDSSGVRGGSESKKGFRTDSLSKWSSLEEEVFDEDASGLQRPLRPKLQRQSNVQDMIEEDSKAATSSPGERVPLRRQDAEVSSPSKEVAFQRQEAEDSPGKRVPLRRQDAEVSSPGKKVSLQRQQAENGSDE